MLGAVLAGTGSAATAAPTLSGSTVFGGHTYEVYSSVQDGGITWTDARSFALGLGAGADLASLTSAAEISAVTGISDFSTLFNSAGLGPWVGGTSTSNGVPYAWLDGTSIANNANGFVWASGQPDWAEAGAGGVLFYPNSSAFGDYGVSCGAGLCGAGRVNGFVVERANVPVPASLALITLGLAGLAAMRRQKQA